MNPNQYPTLTNWSDYPTINIHEFLARFDELKMSAEVVEYYEETKLILIEGDIHITEAQLEAIRIEGINEFYRIAVVVTGNLSVDGKVRKIFYVHGDIYCDTATLGPSYYNDFALFRPNTTIHAKYYVSFEAEEHEIMRTTPKLTLKTPHLFMWFYKLEKLTISPETIIFILGDWDYCQNINLPNPILSWWEFIYVSPYQQLGLNHGEDQQPWRLDFIDKAIHEKKSILHENFNSQSVQYKQAGDVAFASGDYKNAYLAYKHATHLSPKYYPAWFGMGCALFEVGAFTQALHHHQIAADYFPHQQTNLINEALNYAALSAIRCQQYALAIEFATRSIQHNSTLATKDYNQDYLAPAYRFRAEAYYLQGNQNAAIADLKTALELSSYHEAANWLMGLMYYLQGDVEQAQSYYQQATRNYERFKVPYDQAKDTSFLAKPACEVDWAK